MPKQTIGKPTKRQKALAERAFPGSYFEYGTGSRHVKLWRLMLPRWSPIGEIQEIVGDGTTPQRALQDAITRRSQRRKKLSSLK